MKKEILFAFNILVVALGIIWILLSLFSINNEYLFIPVFMLLNAAGYFTLSYFSNKKSKILSIFIILFFLTNIITSITDQRGLLDWFIFSLSILALILYILKKSIQNRKNEL